MQFFNNKKVYRLNELLDAKNIQSPFLQIQCENLIKQKLIELQTCQEINQKNEKMIQQLQPTLEDQQFSQSLTFSSTYKPTSCSATQNGKVIETSTSAWQCCMCDQMIPKNGVFQFTVKIIQIQEIMIAIGFRDVVQSKSYQSCQYIGGGTYNIYNNGQCQNHDQQDKDSKYIAFKFAKNDIIIVEVDIEKKYVKWTKQSTDESFTLLLFIHPNIYIHVYIQMVNVKLRYQIHYQTSHLRTEDHEQALS
ncbi:unnamed protein product [Paramecium octaurelia]|uniref:Uncharacterized protein n=1 Tax=Paramecium octaurelia TaxID=43137 RepID=A0A8S1X4S1_PAROT|nr:unnamed protein product [Paramecium octaurelia]